MAPRPSKLRKNPSPEISRPDPREIYARSATVLEFIAAKGKNPPAAFESQNPERVLIWIRKYTGIPRAIIAAVLEITEERDARAILRSPERVREVADAVQEEFLVASVRQYPWIKSHLLEPDDTHAFNPSA